MNRNVESHFAQLPEANIQRSIFDRSCSYKTSFNAGELIPFYVDEVLPGDTFDITTAKVVRAQTLWYPIMDNMYLDTFYFYVPARLCWEHWKEFCGENTKGAWAPDVDYTIPTIASPEGGFALGTLADYMGLPTGVEWKASDALAPSALPFRAYALICDHFFRDENLQDPLLIPRDDANQQGVNDSSLSSPANGGKPYTANKYHDYFTSALPSPQKGDPVGIPITIPGFKGGTFPVVASDTNNSFGTAHPIRFSYLNATSLNGDSSTTGEPFGFDTDNAQFANYYRAAPQVETGSNNMYITPINLVTTIPVQDSEQTDELSFTINQFRLAYVMQCYLERLARGGSRYSELLLSLFGVRSPDARLQDPEYLGGNRIALDVTETTNTAQTDTDPLGDVGAKSVTSDVHSDFVKSFTEHGYLIGIMCVRYDHSYAQGLNKMWTRKKFTDFYNPMFANLGEVPIYKAEIYATSDTIAAKDNIFGYQEIWSEYRYKPNMVTGEMRPTGSEQNDLAFWHLADYYTSEPTLSADWIKEDGKVVDRVLAVSSDVSNQFWADIYIQNKCTRCMPMYSVPGLEPRL